jgi:hypothetical protein
VSCRALDDGKRTWQTQVSSRVKAGAGRPVPFAQVVGGHLLSAHNLLDLRTRRRFAGVSAVRLSDGKLLRHVGLNTEGGYNEVLGGRVVDGVIILIARSGLIGISTERTLPET